MDSKNIGQFIKRLREENNITQKELASKVYVSRQSVSKWENGISLPNLDILLKLGEIFDITVDEILRAKRKNKIKQKI